jgi:hypothetical protein
MTNAGHPMTNVINNKVMTKHRKIPLVPKLLIVPPFFFSRCFEVARGVAALIIRTQWNLSDG